MSLQSGLRPVSTHTDNRLVRLAGTIVIGALIYLVLAWAAFILVDAKNIFGLRDWLVATGMPNPSVWYHLFRWNGFTEMLQWLGLASGALLAAYGGGHLRAYGHRDASRFWIMMAVTLTFILIEDAGDPRHTIALYVRGMFRHVPSLKVSTIVEGIYFLLLGSIPVYALLRYGRHALSLARTRPHLLMGFGLYGTVAAFSGSRYMKDWFGQAGALLHRVLTNGKYDLIQPQGWDLYLTNFYLMDNFVVESIELIGASAFVGAGLTLLHYVQSQPNHWQGIADGSLHAWWQRDVQGKEG